MKTISLLIAFLFCANAIAVAPYGIKGQAQSSTLYSNVHQFPNNQVTNLGGINALVETGNKNLLSNPGFEHSTVTTGWTTSGCVASSESTIITSGKRSLKMVCTAQTLSVYQDSTLYASQLSGGNSTRKVRVYSTVAGVSVCARSNGADTATCVGVAPTSTWDDPYTVPLILTSTSNGIVIKSSGPITGTIYIDDAEVSPGLPDISSGYLSTNGDTGWASCGHTTADFTGFGTVSAIEIQCKRQGSDLLMKGKFTSGTSTAVEARVNLKLNGVSLTSANSPIIPSIQAVSGSGPLNTNAASQFITLIEPGVVYVTFGAQAAGNSGLTKLSGSSFLATGNTYSFPIVRIPISGWQNSNVIVGSFAEIPTTRGSNGADLQSVYFGAAAGCATACTTGTCFICNSVGNKITSVTWQATGTYRLNGIDGTKYNCTGTGVGGAWYPFYHDRNSSTSTYALVYSGTAVAADSAYNSLICIGVP